ncbi:LLM class flavin-dependent oxidoreductase [Allomesorhizobium camelthorni]|uniref:LLM class flavin-dependent oxidoreductase n=1 Tax=Allomesorhizobium camelthorni TaxID=475069 RepID=A0A6G4WB35_9HYPH|nr:LLM class flavin-dependent oxidoreductase [Mesorhizobium camelthorni]NGO51992.1 LLM class flavin-dependent oxidoreductase [Mesorhizobium camelthorni]
MELGLYTFADVSLDKGPGAVTPHQRLRNLMEEIELADQVGLDVFGLGEHHRPDYAASAPVVALAAAAERTKRIRLTSAVTVLSSDDPVRVFQQFSTLDLLSGGRAEIMAGRGSFIESFPLFGYDLNDYDTLFAEKLELLLKLRESERISWPGGKHTPRIEDRGVYPRPFKERLPIWIAVGGTPNSVARAGVLGLPLALAIIGGEPARFAPLFDLYRQAASRAGHDPAALATSINVHGFVGETTQQAADDFYQPQAEVMNRIGRERGWGPTSRAHFDQSRSPSGALFVGNPEEVAEKIVAHHRIFGNDRFLLQMAIGTMPHAKLMKAIELYGTKVAPLVRRETAAAKASATAD